MPRPNQQSESTIELRVVIPERMLRAYQKSGIIPNGVVSALARALDREGSPLPTLDLKQLEREET